MQEMYNPLIPSGDQEYLCSLYLPQLYIKREDIEDIHNIPLSTPFTGFQGFGTCKNKTDL